MMTSPTVQADVPVPTPPQAVDAALQAYVPTPPPPAVQCTMQQP